MQSSAAKNAHRYLWVVESQPLATNCVKDKNEAGAVIMQAHT